MKVWSRLAWVLGLLSAGACAPALAHARPPKTESDGLALSVGIGSQYPIVGGQAAYYLQLGSSWLRVAPYASLGGLLCVDEAVDCNLGAAFGALGSWGHKHRVLLDLAFATTGAIAFAPHGDAVDSRAVWGFNLAAGYEYMALNGFFFRFDIGVAYLLSPALLPARKRVAPALTLAGVGYKLW